MNSLIRLLKLSIKAVPFNRYALGILGIISSILIALHLGIDKKVAVLGTVIMISLMVLLMIAERISKLPLKHFHGPSKIILFPLPIIFISLIILVVISMFFKWPLDLHRWVDNSYTNIQVQVRAGNNNDEIPIRNDGQVAIYLNSALLSKKQIDGDGIASFNHIEIGSKITCDVEFSEPYKPIVDSNYLIAENQTIVLKVKLRGTDSFDGRVIYNQNPLRDVTVSTEGLNEVTDSMGYFKFNIPESLQKKEYIVWFYKKNFKTDHTKFRPQTDESLEFAMERE